MWPSRKAESLSLQGLSYARTNGTLFSPWKPHLASFWPPTLYEKSKTGTKRQQPAVPNFTLASWLIFLDWVELIIEFAPLNSLTWFFTSFVFWLQGSWSLFTYISSLFLLRIPFLILLPLQVCFIFWIYDYQFASLSCFTNITWDQSKLSPSSGIFLPFLSWICPYCGVLRDTQNIKKR